MIPAASALPTLRSKAAPIPQAPLRTAGFPIAVQFWPFRKFTLFEAIEIAAAAGSGSVELYPGQKIGGDHSDLKFGPHLPDNALHSVKDHLKRHQVAAVNFGVTDVPKDEAEARTIFEFAIKLGLYGVTTESIDPIDTLDKLAIEYEHNWNTNLT